MKNKASLALIELSVMILVFALAAALCLKGFAWSDVSSRRDSLRNDAVTLAQTAAETVKAYRGDVEKTAGLLGGTWQGETLTAAYENGLRLEIELSSENSSFLRSAQVCVYSVESGDMIFTIPVGWQEVQADGN